jgi:hypothetical protein
MECSHALLIQPSAQSLESVRRILHHLVAQLSFGQSQDAIKLGLGNIDAQFKYIRNYSGSPT